MSAEYATPRLRAAAAVAEFRRRIPMMTGFARSFSGNQRIQVKPTGTSPHTDGDTIYLEVPLKMADIGTHEDRNKCGKWDSNGRQLCDACAVIDDFNYTLFHEISHIWGGSFDEPSSNGRRNAVATVRKFMPTRAPADYESIIMRALNDKWTIISYRIHPFVKELHNCFEDARVNEKMALVRPGVRSWRRAFERRLIEDGIRRFDPRTNEEYTFHPTSMPLNVQMAYCLYYMATGDGVPSGFDPYVVKCLADERVAELMADVVGCLDPDRTFEFAVRAFALMADMGFFGNEPQPEPEPEENEEQDEQGAPQGEDNEDDDQADQDDESEADGSSGGEESSPEGEDEAEASEASGDSEGSGDESEDEDDSDSAASDSSESNEGSEDEGDSSESPSGDGAESEDDGESSDGDAQNPSDDEDASSAEAAPESQDPTGAGGESQHDEESSDDERDGSNPGESGDGSPEDAEGNAPEGDAADAPEGADSVAGEGDTSDDDVDDTGSGGDVSDAAGDGDGEGEEDHPDAGEGNPGEDDDQEARPEADGPGEGGVDSQEDQDGDSSSGGDDGEPGDDGGDSDPVDGSAGGDADGGDEPGDSDASDESEAGPEAVDKDDAGEDRHNTGQPGDSTDSDTGDGSDAENPGGDGDSTTGDGEEDADGSTGDQSADDHTPGSGVDEDFDGEPSGEGDGGEGSHGESGSSSGTVGEGNSQLSDDDSGDDPAGGEEADDAPEESPDDGPPRDAEWGDAQEVHDKLEDLFGHHSPNEEEDREVVEELERVIEVGDVFDDVPRNVSKVYWNRWGRHYVHPTYGDQATAWTHNISAGYAFSRFSDEEIGIAGDFRVPDSIIGKALMRARIAFADNARKKDIRHLKAGRVNARALGKRAPINDPRLFRKTARPGKRDYFIVIGLDLSASTTYAPPKKYDEPERPPTNLALIKRSAMAQCEILSRLGVKFAVYGHSAKFAGGDFLSDEAHYAVNMYIVKDSHEPWTEQTRKRLESLGPDEGNLDGHTLQIYRKIAEEQNVTDKIVMYYTDGEIPALNGEEEGEVLVSQIEHCKKKDVTLMGVGVRTDSLGKFGFDYVRVDTDDDLVKVVNNLEKVLER